MRMIDLDPLPGDLDQRLGQIAIEVVGLAAGFLIALLAGFCGSDRAEPDRRGSLSNSAGTPLSISAVTAAWI